MHCIPEEITWGIDEANFPETFLEFGLGNFT